MPVTIVIDPLIKSRQAHIIANASPNNDGVMSAAQAAKLAGLTPAVPIPSQRLLVAQADGTSKALVLAVPFTGDYNVAYSLYTTLATSGVSIGIDIASKTGAGFMFWFSSPFDGAIEVITTPI